jgi:hypothetical protein
MADGPPYGIENRRADLCVFVFRQLFSVELMQRATYDMDGTRPMRVNPIPKTSNGEKLRWNSACVVGHACSGPAKER